MSLYKAAHGFLSHQEGDSGIHGIFVCSFGGFLWWLGFETHFQFIAHSSLEVMAILLVTLRAMMLTFTPAPS